MQREETGPIYQQGKWGYEIRRAQGHENSKKAELAKEFGLLRQGPRTPAAALFPNPSLSSRTAIVRPPRTQVAIQGQGLPCKTFQQTHK